MEKWKIFILILFPQIIEIFGIFLNLVRNWRLIGPIFDEIFRQRVIIFRVTSNLITGMNDQPGKSVICINNHELS